MPAVKPMLLILAAATAGCTLIDQNTFDPHAGNVPVVAAAKPPVAAPTGPPPLMIIGTAKQTDYEAKLRQVVSAARARKPDVVFDVVEIQPPDAVAGQTLGSDAAAVARAIMADGVPQDRVLLALRPETGVPAGQVQVFVH